LRTGPTGPIFPEAASKPFATSSRKLQLRDRIAFIEDQITPDIIA